MPSKYYRDLSCTNCNYKERIVSSPIGKEPIQGVFKAHVELRWCHCCQGVRNIFTGRGGAYKQSDIKALKGLSHESKEELITRKDAIIKQIYDLNRSWTWRKTIKHNRLNLELISVKQKLVESAFIEKTIDDYNQKAKAYYDSFKPQPRCLECQSTDVGLKDYTLDQHTCGGKFVTENPHKAIIGSPLHRFITKFLMYSYDENGFAEKSERDLLLPRNYKPDNA